MPEQKSFPMLPAAHWWTLRRKFKQSIPGIVTDNYLATTLKMGVQSARANIRPFLKTLGIIDEDGKIQDRAKKWRDDGQYAQVCKEMREEIYPQELFDAAPNPDNDRSSAESWFANHTGLGISAVKRMTTMYTLLAEADPTKEPDLEKKGRVRSTEQKSLKVKAVNASGKTDPSKGTTIQKEVDKSTQTTLLPPSININLEVHISADATPDQIDQIFASMAKHIYKRG
jgi:hypothetical protein